MDLKDKVIAVTGGGSGIGRALAVRFSREKPKTLFVLDIDEIKAQQTAELCKPILENSACKGLRLDVTDPHAMSSFVDGCESSGLGINLFCSNAGIAVSGGIETPSSGWEQSWQVNTMAHLYAAQSVIPHMIKRGGGYLLNTVSAAGLLTNLGAGPYSVTKHAAQALAEWLYITYRDSGIMVSTLCPQGVNTSLLDAPTFVGPDGTSIARQAIFQAGSIMEASDVAEFALQGIRDENFLILPHPEVAKYLEIKGAAPEKWLDGMRKLQRHLIQAPLS